MAQPVIAIRCIGCQAGDGREVFPYAVGYLISFPLCLACRWRLERKIYGSPWIERLHIAGRELDWLVSRAAALKEVTTAADSYHDFLRGIADAVLGWLDGDDMPAHLCDSADTGDIDD